MAALLAREEEQLRNETRINLIEIGNEIEEFQREVERRAQDPTAEVPPEVRTALNQLLSRFGNVYARFNSLDSDINKPTQYVFENIPKTKVTRSFTADGAACSICTEKYTLNEEICELSCQHCFHEHCLRRWFQEKYNCPMCRQRIQLLSN